MAIAAAQKFAWHKTIRATTIMFIVLSALMIVGDSHYFYENLEKFFLKIFTNKYILIPLIVTYLLTWFFGGLAGEEIIFHKKNFARVALKYSLIISLIFCLPFMIIEASQRSTFAPINFGYIIRSYYIPLFVKTLFCLFLPWLWATYKMKSIQPSFDE